MLCIDLFKVFFLNLFLKQLTSKSVLHIINNLDTLKKIVCHFTLTLTLCQELLRKPLGFQIPFTVSGCTL